LGIREEVSKGQLSCLATKILDSPSSFYQSTLAGPLHRIIMATGLKKAQAAASSIADTIAGALSFQKSLTDLVRGIRNNKANEAAYVSNCVAEIKQELKSEDKKAKIIAVQKLTYVCFIQPRTDTLWVFLTFIL
jgi:hypothetical protein